MLELICLEEFALTHFVALNFQGIDAFFCQILCVRIYKVLSVIERLLLTEFLAIELSMNRVLAKRIQQCLIGHSLQENSRRVTLLLILHLVLHRHLCHILLSHFLFLVCIFLSLFE